MEERKIAIPEAETLKHPDRYFAGEQLAEMLNVSVEQIEADSTTNNVFYGVVRCDGKLYIPKHRINMRFLEKPVKWITKIGRDVCFPRTPDTENAKAGIKPDKNDYISLFDALCCENETYECKTALRLIDHFVRVIHRKARDGNALKSKGEYLKDEEVAEICGISLEETREWCEKGEFDGIGNENGKCVFIESYKEGDTWYIPEGLLLDFEVYTVFDELLSSAWDYRREHGMDRWLWSED